MTPYSARYTPLFTTLILLIVQANIWSQEVSEDSLTNVGFNQRSSTYKPSKTKYFDLVHTKLNISFDWNQEELIGEAILSLKPYFYNQGTLTLDAKSMTINRISLLKYENNTQKLNYEYDGEKLEIALDKVYSRTDTFKIKIDYIAKPNELETSTHEAITSDKGLYFINADQSTPGKPQQIWTQGETEASSVWFPTIDAPNDRCTQEMNITVDQDFKTISNGKLVSQRNNQDGTRTDYWLMDKPHAPYLFMMAIGKFTSVKDSWNNIPLSYHVDPEYEPYAKDIFGRTPEMMEYFSELLNYPFPWPKYDQVIVRDFVSGAMENTSASVFMEQVQVTRKELIDYNWDDIIAHELFHQWFGDLVTCESWSNLTLNEGFASYGEYLWNEYKYGIDEANYNLMISNQDYFEESSSEAKQLIRHYYQGSEELFDRHSYNKGAAVLHMLRKYLGDEAFFKGLNKYLVDNAYTSVELANLRIAFENTCGEDLNWFFDQWFYYAGHPELLVEQTYQNDTLSLTVQQIQSEEFPIFKLPVFVEIWHGGSTDIYPIIINDVEETYQFHVSESPDLVVFDNERQLLANIHHPKSEEEYLFQFLNDDSFMSRFEVISNMNQIRSQKVTQEILSKALEDPYDIIQQEAIKYMINNEVKPKKYDVLINEALKHKSSKVRSYAVAYLAKEDFKKSTDKVKKAIDDESYLVQSAALTYWFENGQKLSEQKFTSFSEETNANIVSVMADYYLEQSDENSFLWFEKKIKQLENDALYYLIQTYSNKLITGSLEDKGNAISLFEDLAINYSKPYVRLAAYQGLLLMTDIEGVDQKMIEIKKAEKAPQLLELYEEF